MGFTKYERAAHFVLNAFYGRPPGDTSDIAIRSQMIYHHAYYRVPYICLCAASLLITIWEPPTVTSYTGLVCVRIIDFLFLAAVAGDLVVQMLYHGPRSAMRRGWLQAKAVAWVMLLINLLAVLAAPPGSVPYIARVARPILLIERLNNVRKIAGNLARTAAKIANVGVLLILHLLLFGVLGFVLYAGIDDDTCTTFRSRNSPVCSTFSVGGCHNYFADLGESMMHLFALLTGVNFPTIMMPVYNCNPYNVLFFVAFYVIGVYLLLNLTLAVAYAEFRDLMQEEVLLKYARMFSGCDVAVEELGVASSSPQSRGDTVLLRADFVALFGILRPNIDSTAAGLLFDTVDPSGCGEVGRREFRRLILNYYRLKVSKNPPRASQGPGRGGQKSSSSAPSSSSTAASSFLPSPEQKGPEGAAEDAEEEEEGEVLDLAPADELDDSMLAYSARSGSAAVSTDVVHNPLTGLNPADPTTNGSKSDAGNSSRAKRVGFMFAEAEVGEAEEGGAAVARPESVLQPHRDVEIPSWGTKKDRGSTEQQLFRSKSYAIMRKEKELSRPLKSAPLMERISKAVVAAFYRGFSTTTGQDGYGVAPEDTGSAGKRMERRMRTLPRGVPSNSLRGKAILYLRAPLATALFDLCILINTVAVLVQLSLETDEAGSPHEGTIQNLRALQWVMLAVFVTEISSKAAVWGPIYYWAETIYTRLDIVLVATSVMGAILEATGTISRAQASALAFLRFVRLIRAFRMLPGFGLTLASFADVLPVLARYASLLVTNLYIFAIIGQEAFRGTLSISSEAVVASSYGEAGLYTLNFDTFSNSLAVLFYLIVVNDWPIIMEGVVAGVGSKAPRGYFIAFWAVSIVLVLNVIIAFLIEAFQAEKTKRETLNRLERERDIQGNTGGSDGSAGPFGLAPGRDSGVDDWRALILASPVAHAFSGYHLSKARHHLDIYDSLYRQAVRDAFSETFEKGR